MAYWQGVSRALLLPLMALPLAAVLLQCSTWDWSWVHADVATWFYTAAMTFIRCLPYVYAVSMAWGLTRQAASAGVVALIGMFLFEQLSTLQPSLTTTFPVAMVCGVTMGIVVSYAYNWMLTIACSPRLQRWGGSQLIFVLLCCVALVFVGGFLIVSPYVAKGLALLQQALLTWGGGFVVFAYGVAQRLLVPSGLHHVLNHFFWFQLGSTTLPDGVAVTGDLPRFFAGDPTAGRFMAGMYPIMMFALPVAAWALIQEARPEMRKTVAKILIPGIVASFFLGITEPIEFAFLFVAPLLFVVHALLTGVALWLAYVLDVRHGFSFSAGAIDFVVNAHLAHHGDRLLWMGIGFALLYYVLFRWSIRTFNLLTIGRVVGKPLPQPQQDVLAHPEKILDALGGKKNVVHIEACVTRLRVTVHDLTRVDEPALLQLGAYGVIFLGKNHVQVVWGMMSQYICTQIVLRSGGQPMTLLSPVTGTKIALHEVPDPVFAQRLAGDGVAFFADESEVVSPMAGKIAFIYPTKHALGIRREDGVELLLHFGIDSAKVDPATFTYAVQEGDVVQAGQRLLTCDFARLRHAATSPVVVLLVTPRSPLRWVESAVPRVQRGKTIVLSLMSREEV